MAPDGFRELGAFVEEGGAEQRKGRPHEAAPDGGGGVKGALGFESGPGRGIFDFCPAEREILDFG